MVVEDCLALGVRMLKSKGLFYNTFDEGELVWTAAGASADPIRIKFRWLHQPETLPLLTLILTFDQDGIKVTTPQYITLVARQIAANGSGLAWHFECPVLRVPVRKLFLPPGEKVFASQKAHNLCYRSQLLSRKQRERAKREAAERVRQQQAQS